MARPISWLPRLHLIYQSVAKSPRSHYGRHDLERLFELQPRAAQKLVKMMDSVGVGTSLLVERETLLSFLATIRDADKPFFASSEARSKSSSPSKRSLRQLVRDDHAPISWERLPSTLTLSPGTVRLTFTRVEELAAALSALASLLDRDLEEFANRYEIQAMPVPEEESRDVEGMFKELKQMEANRRDI